MHGFNQPAQISNAAALNLKENVDAAVKESILHDNEIAFRVRGPGKRGGSHVSIIACAIYDTQVGVRAEDKIEQLRIIGLGLGKGVGKGRTPRASPKPPRHLSTLPVFRSARLGPKRCTFWGD